MYGNEPILMILLYIININLIINTIDYLLQDDHYILINKDNITPC